MGGHRTSKTHLVEAIKYFWKWFAENSENLKSFYEGDQLEDLSLEIGSELDKIDPQIAWEMGPGKKQPYLFAISGEGNPQLVKIAHLIVQLAPELQDWELYSSRPSRPAPRVVRLPESGEAFDTGEWEFIPLEQPGKGRLDLIIVSGQLAGAERANALRAISIYLDQSLGEDVVEDWIGKFKVESPVASRGNKTYKIAELPDYLLWVTNRKDNPLKKASDHTQ
jgi:hypothetical protein